MKSSVAVMGIIVENLEAVEKLNALLHDYGDSIIGRMGLPHRVKGINIISIALDAPEATIRELEAKLDDIPGISASTAWSK